MNRVSPKLKTTDKEAISVSIIVLAKNEERNIGGVLSATKAKMAGVKYQVIVVDDGSTDKTKHIALSYGAKVISHGVNKGKGAAMKTGVKASDGEIIVFIDGDGAHDPNDLSKLIDPIRLDTADMVIGSRHMPGSDIPKSPLRRKLSNIAASWVISFTISALVPLGLLMNRVIFNRNNHELPAEPVRNKRGKKYLKITDCTSGFRSISRTCWNSLVMRSDKFEIETEMIFEAARNGWIINEVPIKCNWDSKSSRLSIFRDGIKTLQLLSSKLVSLTVNGVQGKG